MKTYVTILSHFLILALTCFALDPLTEFKKRVNQDDKIYQWKACLRDDGKEIFFFSTEKEYNEDIHAELRPSWFVYMPNVSGDDYIKIHANSLVGINDKLTFVGQITQLGKKGIVTIQTDHPKKDPDVAYIYAYTPEGDHLKETLLAKYNPTESNAIYDQYLTEAKRTHITLKEVTP